MKKFTLTVLASSIVLCTQLLATTTLAEIKPASITRKVLDTSHNPASNFLAYTEFKLSGEKLVKALGLDLEVLDPNTINQPTVFDYTAGIESNTYSAEALYALNHHSQMGVLLVNGPRNKKRGGTKDKLQRRIKSLARSVDFANEDIPKNFRPISLPYQSGSPKLDLPIRENSPGKEIKVYLANGEPRIQKTLTNNYLKDFSFLSWDRNDFNKTISPASIGGVLLNEVAWSKEFLGSMHDKRTNKTLKATTSTMDHNLKTSLGISTVDGFQGLLLTEISLDKLQTLQNHLGYDGNNLGAKITPDYTPTENPIWFAHQVQVNEDKTTDVASVENLTVTNGKSTLRDTWMLLWPVSEYFAFSDQRDHNPNHNPAYRAVFDGVPFANAPHTNTDKDPKNNVSGTDAFSMAANLSNLLFKNIEALHFDKGAGTFVDEFSSKQKSNKLTTFDASYALVALSIYQQAQDALPTGDSFSEKSAVSLNSTSGQRALKLITSQADFLVKHAIDENGLVVDHLSFSQTGETLKVKTSKAHSVATQFATIRGLVAASLATKNAEYLKTARAIYLAIESHLYDSKLQTWSDSPGKAAIYTPWTAAAISGGLRSTMLYLSNSASDTEGKDEPALELETLRDRYAKWFKTTINGGLQLAEFDEGTGEYPLEDASITDSDKDGVLSIYGAGKAPVLANKVSLTAH